MVVGEFVFFSAKGNDVYAGVVTSITDSHVVVHEYQNTPHTINMYKPLYKNTKTGKLERKEKPKPEHSVVTCDVPKTAILVVGTIKNYRVCEPALDALKSIGVAADPTH